jgi:osmotically-inducible protein OsmY
MIKKTIENFSFNNKDLRKFVLRPPKEILISLFLQLKYPKSERISMFNTSKSEKKLYLTFITIALGLNLSAFAHADHYKDQNPSNSSYYEDNADENPSQRDYRNSGLSDQDLTNKIRDKIGSGWLSKGYDQVKIQVNNGAVTLQGNVKTWDDKEKVEKEVRNMDGVKSLNSQLTFIKSNHNKHKQKQFSQDTYATSADDQLNKKIRDHVSRGWLWNSYKQVSLNTSNGVVRLEGIVDSMSDQQKLMNEIQKIDGVSSVKSNLKLKNC